jgi:hypothetical protein
MLEGPTRAQAERRVTSEPTYWRARMPSEVAIPPKIPTKPRSGVGGHSLSSIAVFPTDQRVIPSGPHHLKTTATAGGLAGLSLDVSFTVSSTPAAGLQAVQTFIGTRRTDGLQVGRYSWIYEKKRWDAFVDGGKNSPYVTMGGHAPAHPARPYYLTPDEVKDQVVWTTDHGSIQVTDAPGAVALHDEAYFETAIVAVDAPFGKTTRDKVLKVFKWGFSELGTKPEYAKGTRIAGTSSGVHAMSHPTPEWRNIVAHDYPGYTYIS